MEVLSGFCAQPASIHASHLTLNRIWSAWNLGSCWKAAPLHSRSPFPFPLLPHLRCILGPFIRAHCWRVITVLTGVCPDGVVMLG